MSPKLKRIDLRKRFGSEGKCNHPDINCRKHYLVKYSGRWGAGQFTREWYGFNLDAVFDSGVQLDDPDIEELYEICST